MPLITSLTWKQKNHVIWGQVPLFCFFWPGADEIPAPLCCLDQQRTLISAHSSALRNSWAGGSLSELKSRKCRAEHAPWPHSCWMFSTQRCTIARMSCLWRAPCSGIYSGFCQRTCQHGLLYALRYLKPDCEQKVLFSFSSSESSHNSGIIALSLHS